ncbi:hypothetical protein PHYC_03200 [Phycisphaerales bacterium]|nr:hypothetical protein PHYC_03200 [Phycisphaerales bacterium]
MRVARLVLVVWTMCVAVSGALAQELYKPHAGPFDVRVVNDQWRDTRRERDVPVRIYIPRAKAEPTADARFPVVIFSHGLGGSRVNYRYFGEHLASHGYIVIFPSHAGSDTAALLAWGGKPKGDAARREGWLKASIGDPENLRNRPRDVSFLIDQLGVDGHVKDIADRSRVGVGGHSFGAYTSLCVAGMVVDLPEGRDQSFRDPRVKAVLPMSPQGSGTMGIDEGAWKEVGVPVLCLTGTRDYGEGARSAEWRREPFENIRGVEDYLITITGAGHMTFSNPRGEGRAIVEPAGAPGRGEIPGRFRERAARDAAEVSDEEQARYLDLIRSVGAAFFDAYVKEDAKAKEWLAEFSLTNRSDCRVEYTPGGAKP